MGRNKKSDTAKMNDGTYRDDRKQTETKSIKGKLKNTDFIFKTTNSTYKLLESIAEETGVASRQFCVSLYLLAENLHQWASLVRYLRKNGLTYEVKTTSGSIVDKPRAQAEQMDKAFKRVIIGLKSHGWDPASAASVVIDNSDNKYKLFEALSKLMSGGDLENEFD